MHSIEIVSLIHYASAGRALRILVADDDRDAVDLVLPAVSVFRPDAIIMDIAIPEMSGYAVAHAVHPDVLVARQVGFDHHLVKPCDPVRVLQLLEPLRPHSGPPLAGSGA